MEPTFEELVTRHLAPQPQEGEQPAEGESQEVEGPQLKPRFYIRNNHIQAAGRKRDRSESEAAVRKRVGLNILHLHLISMLSFHLSISISQAVDQCCFPSLDCLHARKQIITYEEFISS